MITKKTISKQNRTIACIVALITLLPLSTVNAAFDPAVVNIEGVEVVPVLNISETYDSNILSEESAGKSDFKTVVNAKADASIKKGANNYSLGLGLGTGFYADSSADNFFDSNAGVNLYQSFTRKLSVRFKAGRLNRHENRGSGYNKGNASQLTEPDKYHLNQYQGVLRYGSNDAIGRIVVKLNAENRIYDSRRDVTKTRDRDTIGGAATFFYRVLPKTSALFEISHRLYRYDNNEAFNSQEQTYFTGAKWDISAITSGTIKAGMLVKDFDNSNRSNFSGFSWQVGARWTPLSYSTVDLLTKGRTEETNGAGDYIDAKSAIAKWTHFWNDKVNTAMTVNLTQNNYKPNGRSEDYFNFAIKANYNARRWMNTGLSYSYVKNRSSVNKFEYVKNILSAYVSLAL